MFFQIDCLETMLFLRLKTLSSHIIKLYIDFLLDIIVRENLDNNHDLLELFFPTPAPHNPGQPSIITS